MMHTRLLPGLILATNLYITGCSSGENGSAPPSPANQPAEEKVISDPGQKIFTEKCMACHGADGTAGIANAANLQVSKLGDTEIIQTITHGKNSMPAFGTQLSQNEIAQVAGYVHSLRK